MIELIKVKSSKKRGDLNKEYIKTLGAPIDGFWENVVIGTSQCYQIIYDKKLVGHFFVDKDKTLVQFYVSKEYYTNAPEIFIYIIKSNKVKDAAVSTKESEYLALCLDNQKSVEVDTYLFVDNQKISHELNSFRNTTFRLANKGDINIIKNKCDAAYDGYYEDLIENDNLFVLYEGSSLLGIGEFRIIKSNLQYGDIGVVVAEEYHRRGIGTYIINQLKEHCYNKGLEPLACCNVRNMASKSTLEKAGFITNNRVLHVIFK
ncbi:GNAT family N-acetyltransferase [Oceanirhabdus seepicola]|uniref:GNAT family N-acetyltransferase n=1 Tax=Oceanirhabdus seepicola TaxID=2828781 RepID=A0A9J6P8C9_9CLOT|nr:GNAT family N-acetyltransferase [Oceanirhabdus seepicola]